MKHSKKCQESICNISSIRQYSLMSNRPTGMWCNMLETLEIQKKYTGDQKLSVEHTLHVQTEG